MPRWLPSCYRLKQITGCDTLKGAQLGHVSPNMDASSLSRAAFFFVVFWVEEITTVMLWLATAAIVGGGSLWIYHNPNAALEALGILVVFTWSLILSRAIYLPLCWWHGVKPRAPWKPWVRLKQHEPWLLREHAGAP
jgi:hypothetical protein